MIFVPFETGRPSGARVDLLMSFVDNERSDEVSGRPVGVAADRYGAVLVADDAGEAHLAIWAQGAPCTSAVAKWKRRRTCTATESDRMRYMS